MTARLDHDGNEIPTDEEEEYERNRAHMRIRAQALSGPRTGIDFSFPEARTLPPAPTPGILNSYLTQTPLQFESPTEAPLNFDRRLRSYASNASIASTILANPETSPEREVLLPETAYPVFRPSPLPWPVSTPPTTASKRKLAEMREQSSTHCQSPLAGR